jgi:hypothetical protein
MLIVRILKNLIELPCQDCVWKEHLLSKAFENLLDDQVYLTNDEIFLKQHTGESIRMFYATYEQITLNKIKLDYDISRCRFKIDEHRVELKQKIDDAALDLIERTRGYEASYLKAIRPISSNRTHFEILLFCLSQCESFKSNTRELWTKFNWN